MHLLQLYRNNIVTVLYLFVSCLSPLLSYIGHSMAIKINCLTNNVLAATSNATVLPYVLLFPPYQIFLAKVKLPFSCLEL